MHGERARCRTRNAAPAGSSPRAWGTLDRARTQRAPARFIPTCMGNASPVCLHSAVPQVHPHVHGERRFKRFNDNPSFGSSPRAWGTLDYQDSDRFRFRFIPTCMGNATPAITSTAATPVHPHVHGERMSNNCVAPVRHGSSPRAWGTLDPVLFIKCIFRFIPTCMGNAALQ